MGHPPLSDACDSTQQCLGVWSKRIGNVFSTLKYLFFHPHSISLYVKPSSYHKKMILRNLLIFNMYIVKLFLSAAKFFGSQNIANICDDPTKNYDTDFLTLT